MLSQQLAQTWVLVGGPFFFLARRLRHSIEGEWLPSVAADCSSHLEDHAPTLGSDTKESQGFTESNAGEGSLLAALLCCLFPLLIGRGIAGSKLWSCSP